MPHAIDTNIAIYALGPSERAVRAFDLLDGATISVQVLNEYANVALRKLAYTSTELDSDIELIRAAVSAIRPMDGDTHDLAREINTRYKYSIYDSLIIASALLNGCDTLYTEDMQDGQIIEEILIIRNPFGKP